MKKVLYAAMLSLLSLSAQAQIPESLRKLQIAEYATVNLYVDSVDENKLVEDAIRGMLEKLDPHSTYSNAKEVKQMNEPLNGNFEGIGVQFNMIDDTLMVIQPVTNGPSEKVGIIAGDRIVTVNDTAIAGVKMSKEEIMRRLRGPKGTVVMLGVVRTGIKDQLTFKVTRDKIPVHSVDATYMLRPGIGYIRIGNFGANTHQEFCEALEKLKQQGMTDLVLDLQENGGGYLQAAVNIADELLARDELIVYTEGRRVPRQEYHAHGHGKFMQGKIVILVDEYTASAAEIVTGAVQDQDRGQVVGRRTFGKGLVQRPIDLPDGSMIRLTTAHYYSPSGRCIQRPYEKGKKTDYDKDLLERLNSGELTNPDSIRFPDSLKFKTLKQQRVVYGGGGIMPDEYVPLDTLQFPKLYRELMAQSIVNRTCMKYLDKNRSKLHRKYKLFDKYLAEFEVPDDMIELLKEQASKTELKYTDEEFNQILPVLKVQLKALLARDLWEMNEYYHVINSINNIFNKGVEVIKR